MQSKGKDAGYCYLEQVQFIPLTVISLNTAYYTEHITIGGIVLDDLCTVRQSASRSEEPRKRVSGVLTGSSDASVAYASDINIDAVFNNVNTTSKLTHSVLPSSNWLVRGFDIYLYTTTSLLRR